MKKFWFLMLAGALSCQLFAIPNPKDAERRKVYREGKKLEGIFKVPTSKKGSPVILFLGGGRPWQGNGTGGALIKSGADVRVLSGVYLAGLSGSYIRSLPHQTEEPKPVDAITPEFKHLDEYEMLFIDAIPEKEQKKIFTPERVAAVKKFVSGGGLLLLTINAPEEELGDLMPVKYGNTCTDFEGIFVRKPAGKNFEVIPDVFQMTDPFRVVTLVEGAKSISDVIDANGNVLTSFVAVKPYGKGKVMYLNTEKNSRKCAQHFAAWAYSQAFITSLVAELSGKPLQVRLFQKQPTEPPKTIAEKSVELALSEMKIADDAPQAEISGRTVTFGNGAKLVVKEKTYDAYLPGSATPFVVDAAVPQILFSEKQMTIEDSSAEAVGMKDTLDASKIKWTLAEVKGGDCATIVWTGDDGTVINEEIKTSRLDLDGTTYRGIARRANVVKCPKMISGFNFTAKIDVDAVKMRRMAAYQPPRGYAEYDMTKKTEIDSREWGFFSDGQPFGWIEGKNGVFANFTDNILNTLSCRIVKPKGAKKLPVVTNKAGFGYQKAPLQTSFVYYMVGDVKAPTDNHWMAMYQFQRYNLRKVANIPEFPAYPNATWSNSCSKEQRDATIETIGKAGIRYTYIPACPSCMEDVDKPARIELQKKVLAAGSKPYVWSPCGHSHGAGKEYDNKTHWFAYDAQGKAFKYFGGNFPVIDQGDPDFLKWYLPKVQKAIDGGLAGVWFDMGGAATGTRNFAKPDSPIGLMNLVKYIYPAFYKNGCFVAIEGQSPLVLEGFWYRADVYTPMGGKEFVFVGDLVYGDGMDFDYFRSSMFGFFTPVAFENHGTKFERIPGELKQLEDAAHYARTINRALDICKMPFIRKTDFGTSWMSPTGGALFFYDAVTKLDVKLPENFVPVAMIGEKGDAVELNGKMPESVGARTLIVLEKK